MTRLLSFVFVLILGGSVSAQSTTWVHGSLSNEKENALYLKFAKRMHGFYQAQGSLTGSLVSESEFQSRPAGAVVFIGPINAFRHPEWFGTPLLVSATGTLRIETTEFNRPGTGIYIRSKDRKRVLYTGLDLPGFRSIFSVRTGSDDCTITRSRGKVSHKGRYGDQKLLLKSLPFLVPCPDADQIEKLELPENAIRTAKVALSTKDSLSPPTSLHPEFKTWLKKFVEGKRALFVGEDHWNESVNRSFNLILREILAQQKLSAVVLELNYSFSGYYDHYVCQTDDKKAAAYLKQTLNQLVGGPSVMETLEVLRKHNKKHPDSIVHVACSDMEWNFPRMKRTILEPFFRKLDPNFRIPDPYRLKQQGRPFPRKKIRVLLRKAAEKKFVGDYPFLTPEYLGRVMENVWDTASINEFSRDRQRFIVRNTTVFGQEHFDNGFVLLKGGSYHAVKRRVKGEDFYRDAAYLHEVFPATKGKLVTLCIRAIGYNFKSLVGVDLNQRMASASSYNRIVREFQRGLEDGTADATISYSLDPGKIAVFPKLIMKIGAARGESILRVDAVDWDALGAAYGVTVRATNVTDYDAVIFVTCGLIELMRNR